MTDEEYYAQLNTVNLASGALIRNRADEVLIVNPTYREGWLIPGGVVDRDESPMECCRREIREEIGLDLPLSRLLCLEYLPRREFKPEAIHFIFDGGLLDDEKIRNIRLPEVELSEYRFCPPGVACDLLDSDLAVRFRAAWGALNSPQTAFLERGRAWTGDLSA